MVRIAIFASGEGTNAQCFIDYFGTTGKKQPDAALTGRGNGIVVSLVVSDNPAAKVLQRAKNAGIPQIVVDGRRIATGNSQSGTLGLWSEDFVELLRERVDFIVLAGFLRLVPPGIIKAFSGRIVNIHPALLPEYGGKGMYGDKVHESVIANKEKKSGITIHKVNEKYDEGAIIFQKECEVKEDDTPQSLAERIHVLEHRYYTEVVEKEIKGILPLR